jgi:trk system potassium uptake protein TrkA
VLSLVPVADGRVHLTEVRLDPAARVVGRRLGEAGLPAGSIVAYLLRDGAPVVPNGQTELQAGDRLMLVTLPGHHGTALAVLVDPRPGG